MRSRQHTAERLPESRTEKTRLPGMDLPFLILVILLVAIGVVMMFSASYPRAYHEQDGDGLYFFKRQVIFACLGLFIMYIVSRLNIELWRRFSVHIYFGALVLLGLVLLIGTSGGGAKRWIILGPVSIQPSEIAKLGVVLFFSAMISRFKGLMRNPIFGVVPFLIALLLVVGLLWFEPHLSAIVIICLTGGSLMLLGGTEKKWFIFLGIGAAVGFALFLSFKGYASDRIQAWLHPENYARDKGYQVLQSLYAIGSGGLFGRGFGKSRQKYLYLPEEHNDYIFPVVCEELGFVGATLIVLLFALLVIRGYWIAMHAPNRFGKLVAAGLTTLLALQVILNIGVVTNTLPSTGISLPFFSYGGTALILQLVEMGIILSISRSGKSELLRQSM